MKDIFEQLSHEAKNVSFSPREKQEMRSRLVMFAQTHTAEHADPASHTPSYVVNFFHTIFNRRLRPVFIALAIVLVLGSGTAYAAEHAIPGDILYPVKIHVTEPVRDVIELSPQKQAEWDVEKTERRLIEAEKLAEQGKLNTRARVDLESKIEVSIDRVTEFEDRRDIHEKKKIDSTENLRAVLRAHGDILDSLISEDQDDDSRGELRSIRDTIKSRERTPKDDSKREDREDRLDGNSKVKMQKIKDDDRGRDENNERKDSDNRKNDREEEYQDFRESGVRIDASIRDGSIQIHTSR